MVNKKWTSEQILDMIKLRDTCSLAEISKIYNISNSRVYHICKKHEYLSNRYANTQRLINLSSEYLQEIINISTSISKALVLMGFDARTHYNKILTSLIITNNLDISKMKVNSKKRKIINNDCEIFKKNSTTFRSVLRSRIINGKLIEYKCAECPIIDTYNGKSITLQVDHINGIHNDNRLINLRFLCPNCHSQTITYVGRNKHITCE